MVAWQMYLHDNNDNIVPPCTEMAREAVRVIEYGVGWV